LSLDLQALRASKSTGTEEHIYTCCRIPLSRIVVTNRGSQTPHAAHHRAKIDTRLAVHLQSVGASITHIGPSRGAADERLTWHATVVETIAAHQVSFDQRHACA